MEYDKEYVIRLSGLDLGQVIDGMEQRAQAYRNAECYHEHGEHLEDDHIPEVNDAEEARKLAEHYERIIAAILEQKANQE